MPRGPGGLLLVATLIAFPLTVAACGGRAAIPPDAKGAVVHSTVRTASTSTSAGGSSESGTTMGSGAPSLPSLPSTSSVHAGSAPATPRTTTATGGPAATPQDLITHAYETYLYDLSGLDDTLSQAWISPLASVTTNRLAQASVRQAAAILDAKEHGVGTLRDDHVAITMTGPDSAVLADCQDENGFYLVNDSSSTPDTFVEQGYFVGSAQMVLQGGHWLVDVFTTTHDECDF